MPVFGRGALTYFSCDYQFNGRNVLFTRLEPVKESHWTAKVRSVAKRASNEMGIPWIDFWKNEETPANYLDYRTSSCLGACLGHNLVCTGFLLVQRTLWRLDLACAGLATNGSHCMSNGVSPMDTNDSFLLHDFAHAAFLCRRKDSTVDSVLRYFLPRSSARSIQAQSGGLSAWLQ